MVIGLFIGSIFIIDKAERKAYERALENKPSEYYIEEAMEDILISTGLYIYDYVDEEDYIIYYIEDLDSGWSYKTLWVLENQGVDAIGLKLWKWAYKSHVRIN